jgi:dephospho-CoA kinase
LPVSACAIVIYRIERDAASRVSTATSGGYRERERSLLKIGLTGGIASGKSAVGEMFVKLGAHLIQADAVAHSLMEPGRRVYEAVVRRFGREILNPDGSINRPRLAEAAFGASSGTSSDTPGDTPPRIKELNEIVHPAVIAEENAWMEDIGCRDPKAIAIVEAALILEAGAAERFDRLIVVTCRPEQRCQRFAHRLGISEDAARVEVTRRMAAQLSDEEKIKAADFVIDNSGSLEATEQQVQNVFAALRDRHL